jgi:hypothetical protein
VHDAQRVLLAGRPDFNQWTSPPAGTLLQMAALPAELAEEMGRVGQSSPDSRWIAGKLKPAKEIPTLGKRSSRRRGWYRPSSPKRSRASRPGTFALIQRESGSGMIPVSATVTGLPLAWSRIT